jgi:dephospho-CoA kinase
VAEVPLLFELGLSSGFDRVILVKADRQVKVDRLMERDHVSKADAERLLNIQMPDEEKEKLSDYILENNGSQDELIKKIDHVYEMIYFSPMSRGKILDRGVDMG